MQIGDENLNMTLNKSSEDDFNTAIEMSMGYFDYLTLLNFLQSEKIVEKQIAVLKLDEIKSREDANLLVSNLVGQDGKIREAVAYKINQLAKDERFTGFFLDKNKYDIFLQGVMDINGNVCRQIVDLAAFLKPNKNFSEYFAKGLAENTIATLKHTTNLTIEDKKYVISKRYFQLYWCLEVLFEFAEFIDTNELKQILLQTGTFDDYTIREKTAKILSQNNFDNDNEVEKLKEQLKNDENYYVRRYLA